MGLGELTLAGAVTGEDADVPVLQPPTCLSGRISAWTRSAGREAGTSGGKNVQTSIIGSRWFAWFGDGEHMANQIDQNPNQFLTQPNQFSPDPNQFSQIANRHANQFSQIANRHANQF